MKWIRKLTRISTVDAAIAGGKGASLGEMTRAGISVPPGFVVVASAFEHFLTTARLTNEIETILSRVDHKEINAVERASKKIKELILATNMPTNIADAIIENFKRLDARHVAVRSSATAEDGRSAAWAGQLDTFLNTTEKDLLENVQKCWASLFTPRSIFYRFNRGMHGKKISIAVVVQKMVQSEVSGTAFSVHPVTEDRNQIIIEAGFGLGEAIVSGHITPDSYIVDKTLRRVMKRSIAVQTKALYRGTKKGSVWKRLPRGEGAKPALTDKQILELAEFILRIEKHYGFPCDIEWAYERGQFYLTQSRPITTLTK